MGANEEPEPFVDPPAYKGSRTAGGYSGGYWSDCRCTRESDMYDPPDSPPWQYENVTHHFTEAQIAALDDGDGGRHEMNSQKEPEPLVFGARSDNLSFTVFLDHPYSRSQD